MLFITLLSPKGKGSDAVEHIKTLKAVKGITIHEVFFTFGRFDSVIVFEAASEATAMKFVMQIGLSTNHTMETLVAVPKDKMK